MFLKELCLSFLFFRRKEDFESKSMISSFRHQDIVSCSFFQSGSMRSCPLEWTYCQGLTNAGACGQLTWASL